MISSLSLYLCVFVTAVAVASEAFWQDKFTAQYYGKLTRLLFGGKVRSLITTHMFLIIGIGLVFFLDSGITIFEIVAYYLVSEIFILGAARGIWMNLRIGSYSSAPRHKILVEGVIRMYTEDRLDDFYLKTILESLVAETKHGNSVSNQLLRSLYDRDDELGVYCKELVAVMDCKENLTQA